MTLYKVLGPDRVPIHGGAGQWPEPGVWREVEGELVPCQNALHGCLGERQLLNWLKVGCEVWELEADESLVDDDDKVYARRMRLLRWLCVWDMRTNTLFKARCAERVLPIFEARFPDDDRPRQAIAASLAFARGELTKSDLHRFYRDAYAAAYVAYDAYNAAAYAAADAYAAAYAAAAAARDAAYASARDSACVAAEEAEWRWQEKLLADIIHGRHNV